MYSEYQGHALIEAYLENRFAVLREQVPEETVNVRSTEGRDRDIIASVLAALLNGAGAGKEYARSIRKILRKELPDLLNIPDGEPLSTTEELSLHDSADDAGDAVDTGQTLTAAVMRLAAQDGDTGTADLLDAFLHHFEVSKKLYHRYDADLRGGREGFRDARLYWLLGLALCLYLLRTGRMKYASTLLKCTDLLCSLPAGKLREELPVLGLSLLLAAEIACMQKLAEEQGVYAVE